MKVLAINGSPNKSGCTYTALSKVTEQLLLQDIEVEMIQIGTEPLRGCTSCRGCAKLDDKKCVFGGDVVNECISKMKNADAILLGSPVYYGNISGSMKSFLDRFCYAGAPLRHKVGAAIVSSRRAGGVAAYHQLSSYLTLAGSIIAPTHYWNEVHGARAEEVLSDLEGMQMMEMLGKNMAWLMKIVDEGKKSIEPPVMDKRVWTNFIR